MLPIVTLVGAMIIVLMLGAQNWQGKTRRTILISVMAVLQTVLLLVDMFMMKPPKM